MVQRRFTHYVVAAFANCGRSNKRRCCLLASLKHELPDLGFAYPAGPSLITLSLVVPSLVVPSLIVPSLVVVSFASHSYASTPLL